MGGMAAAAKEEGGQPVLRAKSVVSEGEAASSASRAFRSSSRRSFSSLSLRLHCGHSEVVATLKALPSG